MRRRRRKNPLLTRILLISVGIHIIALPILAHFGTFREIQRRYFDTQMVVMAPSKIPVPEEHAKPKVVVKQQGSRSNKASAGQKHAAPQQRLSNLPSVVASQGPGEAGGPTVDQGSGGTAGQVPTAGGNGGSGGGAGDGHAAAVKPPQVTTPTLEKAPEKPVVTDHPKIATPTPTPVVKHAPVYADAQPTFSPQPTIPDDLRYDAVDKTTVLEFVVGPDGSPTSVKVAASCGIEALDKAAVESAKQWKFKPATRDGEPISRSVRLKVEFKVE